MAKARIFHSSYPENPPEWYWIHGLHDACIIEAEAYEFPFDYKEFVKAKNKYSRNCMTLRLNCAGAMYDRIKEIRLFNYKVLSDNVSLEDRKKIWWLADKLVDCGEYYTLEIELQDFNSEPEDFTFKIKFERAEVDR